MILCQYLSQEFSRLLPSGKFCKCTTYNTYSDRLPYVQLMLTVSCIIFCKGHSTQPLGQLCLCECFAHLGAFGFMVGSGLHINWLRTFVLEYCQRKNRMKMIQVLQQNQPNFTIQVLTKIQIQSIDHAAWSISVQLKKSDNKIQGWGVPAWLKIKFNALLATFVFKVRYCIPYKKFVFFKVVPLKSIYPQPINEGIVTIELLKYVYLFLCLH